MVPTSPTRRRLLRLSGSALVAGLAGCLSQAPHGEECTRDAVSFEAGADELVVTDDAGTLAFTLRNGASCPVTVTPDAWVVERRVEEGWRQAVAGDGGAESRTLPGGGEHVWSLGLSPRETPASEDTTHVTVDLDPGRYAFVVTAELVNGERFSKRARFDLAARTAVDGD